MVILKFQFIINLKLKVKMSNPFASDRNIFANISKGKEKVFNKQKEQTSNFSKDSNFKLHSNTNANTNNNFGPSQYNNINQQKDQQQNNKNAYNHYYNQKYEFSGGNTGKVTNQKYQTGFYQQRATFGEGNQQQNPKNAKAYDVSKQMNYVLTSQKDFQQNEFNTSNSQKQNYNVEKQSQSYSYGYRNQQGIKNLNLPKFDKNNYMANPNGANNYNEYIPNYDYSRNSANQIDSKVEPYSYKTYGQPSNQDSRNFQFSPINQTSKHRLEESQFMNIDAMSEDISKLLASSQNQAELCKILGIDRDQLLKNQNSAQNQQVNSQNSTNNFTKKDNWMNPNPIQTSKYDTGYNRKPQNKIGKGNEAFQKPSAFHRGTFGEPEVKVYDADQFQDMDNRERINFDKKAQQNQRFKEEEGHLPTFVFKNDDRIAKDYYKQEISKHGNYKMREQQPQVFNYSRQPKEQFKYEPIKKGEIQMENIPQVLNYANFAIGNQLDDSYNLQKTIKQQMSRICTNGRIRTFLTANQKIQAAIYRFHPL